MAHPDPSQQQRAASEATSLDLRQRKRIRTKRMVQTEALRLFAERGYDGTSVEDIARAAAISPRTFYRYFQCKEDVVLWDEYDELRPEQLWDGRSLVDPYVVLVRRLRELTAELYRRDPARLLARTRLIFAEPGIRARSVNAQMTLVGTQFAYLTDRAGASLDDLPLVVNVAAVMSAMLVAMEHWQRHDGQPDLPTLIDTAISALADGASHLDADQRR